jgi:hypothetical protein
MFFLGVNIIAIHAKSRERLHKPIDQYDLVILMRLLAKALVAEQPGITSTGNVEAHIGD